MSVRIAAWWKRSPGLRRRLHCGSPSSRRPPLPPTLSHGDKTADQDRDQPRADAVVYGGAHDSATLARCRRHPRLHRDESGPAAARGLAGRRRLWRSHLTCTTGAAGCAASARSCVTSVLAVVAPSTTSRRRASGYEIRTAARGFVVGALHGGGYAIALAEATGSTPRRRHGGTWTRGRLPRLPGRRELRQCRQVGRPGRSAAGQAANRVRRATRREDLSGNRPRIHE